MVESSKLCMPQIGVIILESDVKSIGTIMSIS